MSEEDRKDYRSLGEILRDARMSQKKSIEDLSDATKIAPRILRAIESDDLDQVADPIYAKSFVRTLAETLRLDADWLLTKLEHAEAAVKSRDESPEPQREESTWHIDNVRIQRVEAPRKRSFPRLAIGVVVIVAVALVGLWFVRQGNGKATAPGRTLDSARPLTAADSTLPLGTAAVMKETPLSSPPASSGESEENESQPSDDPSPSEEPPPRTPSAPEKEPPTDPVSTPAEDPGQDPASDADEERPPDSAKPAADAAPPPPLSPEPAPRPRSETSETATAASGPDEEIIVDESTAGLSSIVRRSESEAERPAMVLQIRATGRVEVYVAADGASGRKRTLSKDDVWELTAQDHFSVEISDPRRVEVALDGVRHDPPPGLVGEWILYPNP